MSISYSGKAKYELNRESLASPRAMVVHLTDGTDDYYLSDTFLKIQEGFIHEILKSSPYMTEGVDIFAKQWTVSEILLAVMNKPFMADSTGKMIRFSDIAEGFVGEEVNIYGIAGYDSSSALGTHGILLFNGIVIKSPEYNFTDCKLKIVSGIMINNPTLPENKMADIYTETPVEYANKKIPLVWGEFTYNGDDDAEFSRDGYGMALGYPTNAGAEPKYVFADHAIDSFNDQVWIKEPSFLELVMNSAPTTNVNDSSRATAVMNELFYAYLYPNSEEDFVFTGSPVDPSHVYDRKTDTYAIIRDTLDSSGIPTQIFTDDGWGLAEGRHLTEIAERSDLISLHSQCKFLSDLPVSTGIWVRITIKEGTTNVGMLTLYTDDIGGNWKTLDWSTFDATGRSDLGVGLRYTTIAGHTSSDGTPNNIDVGKLYSLRLRAGFKPDTLYLGFAEIKGKEYTSWISSRSSNYASGDAIEDPVGIAEDVLRNLMNIATAELDLTSFIDCENTNVKQKVNIHDDYQLNAFELLRRISEQSTFCIGASGNGRYRAINLNDKTPTTTITFDYSHIIDTTIKISKSPVKASQINLKTGWQEEYQNYQDVESITDGLTSFILGSHIEYNADWKFLRGSTGTTPARVVVDHLINDTDGIWFFEHNKISFEAKGAIGWHLEVGDWFEIDSATIDQHIKVFGNSFSGKQFLITKLIKKIDSTFIEGIELY